MKTLVLSMIVALAALVALNPAPARAQAERAYGQLDHSYGQLIPVAAGGRSISDMTTEHLIAVGVGAVAGLLVLDSLLGGGMGSVLGLVGGALIGDWWYREALWPFD